MNFAFRICSLLAPDPAELNLMLSCVIFLNILVVTVLSIFLFVWLIVGCVWVFSVYGSVDYYNTKKSNYCDVVLYRTAFALIIVSLIWASIQFLLICVRQYFPKESD